jgi:hypothetical protein
MLLSDEQKLALASRFLSVWSKPDAKAIKQTSTANVVWSFPGKSAISGEAVGVKAVIARAKVIASSGLHLETVRAVYSRDGIALILHQRATSGQIMFEQHIAAVFIFRGDKIIALDTHLSDVAMADKFFVKDTGQS